MATLTKFTFVFRDFRVIGYHRVSINLVNKLHTHATFPGVYKVFATNNNYIQNGKYKQFLQHNNTSIYAESRYFTEKKTFTPIETEPDTEKPVKKSLFQRFKEMYRDYWYVLVPVHVVTSAFWFGGFYYAAKSGIDIVAFVEKLHLSDAIVDKIKNSGHSTAGYIAISYALYKIFTPLRYTVTLGGTTISINYLTKWGYIKPIPKGDALKKMISDKRHSLREKRIAFKDRMIRKLNEKKRWRKKR